MSDVRALRQMGPSEDFEDLYENAPCGYLSLRPDGRIVKANLTLSTWTGFSPDELIGKKFHDLLSVGGKIFYETHFAPLLRMQGFFHEVALDLQTASGKKLAVLANAVERRNEAGDLIFTRLTIFQATQRRRHERELWDSLSAERRIGELREQFIAVLGHDLRNPLAAISSGLRLLRREDRSEEARNRVISLMEGSAVRMSRLIDNVLDFARGRLGGGMALHLSKEDLSSVLNQVVDELKALYPDREVKADIRLPEPVVCDHVRIGQLASNLLGNALSHGSAEKPVRIRARCSLGNLELLVANSGVPIPPEARARLFEPFVRGSGAGGREGLGLGLHIASEIAKAHGGKLTVDSDENETCFTLRIPLLDEVPG